jgi:glycine hydroxymethyltransferase
MKDAQLEQLIQKELARQEETIDLIASENYSSKEVLSAVGSVFSNKYAEGYPRKRYYRGNAVVDEVEELAQKRGLALFGLDPEAWHVNVQPYSGSPANVAVYLALVPLGEKIMGMRLDMGGHLTHGHAVSATGKIWTQIPYGVSRQTHQLDYEELLRLAKREQPKLIVAGYTAYPRVIDWKRFREITDSVGAILMVDMSHIAGLVAGDAYPSPFPYADVVTSTTHKTLRGPRSAVIFSRKKFSKKIDKAVFPGLQGGPHMNHIAAIAAAFHEASRPEFKEYVAQIIKNAKVLSQELSDRGWRIISGGTDSHLLLIDTWSQKVGGEDASVLLEEANIIVNKNTIPYDERPPMDPSGLRLGTAAVTTRGMKDGEMKRIAEWTHVTLQKKRSSSDVRNEVLALCKKFPLGYT